METKIKVGIIGALTLLVAFGGVMILSPGEMDNSYYCPSTGEWGIFYGGVSGTGLTAYPYEENRSGYKRCTSSKWIKLKDYAEELNITIDDLLDEDIDSVPENYVQNGRKYLCSVESCVEIE